MKNRTDKILLIAFVLTLAVYVVIFAACFSELPINPSPLHQVLVLYFHFVQTLVVEADPVPAHTRGWAGLYELCRVVYSGLDPCPVVVRRPSAGVRLSLGGI